MSLRNLFSIAIMLPLSQCLALSIVLSAMHVKGELDFLMGREIRFKLNGQRKREGPSRRAFGSFGRQGQRPQVEPGGTRSDCPESSTCTVGEGQEEGSVDRLIQRSGSNLDFVCTKNDVAPVHPARSAGPPFQRVERVATAPIFAEAANAEPVTRRTHALLDLGYSSSSHLLLRRISSSVLLAC